MELFADIILPLSGSGYTYRIREDLSGILVPGMAVSVPLGPRKIYLGIVHRIHTKPPSYGNIRETGAPVWDRPLVSTEQLAFWEWLSEYYMCSLGDVMRFALPSALKPSGFSDEEFFQDNFKPRRERFLSLAPGIDNPTRLNETIDSLARTKAQQAALIAFCGLLPEEELFDGEIPMKRLDVRPKNIRKLIERGILVAVDRESPATDGRLQALPPTLPSLTERQREAKEEISRLFQNKACVLLHGITGSGKTEIYMHLIARELETGHSVLYLVPEIAMTAQLVRRIQAVFGNRVIPYHSHLTDRQRAEIYRKLNRDEGGYLVLGARSAIFLPFPTRSLLIVDEEHDSSFKQTDSAPRYHARDCAVWLARSFGARCLLGSATPSIESFHNACSGKYGLVRLTERYGSARLPHIIVSDTIRAAKRGERKTHFNKILLDSIGETLAAGRQIMLFQNRRGFAPYVECVRCGWTARCPQCSVTLTLHKNEGVLRCHYCGYSAPLPIRCPECHADAPKPCGFGTEKIEEELHRLFPDARIARLDRDTSTSVRKFETTVSNFAARKIDILVGTQIIIKGFDFPGVSLVGILNADNLLNYPDFRASERAFQQMMQAAGRAGRTDDCGEVIIQTAQPDNPVIRQVREENYEEMVRTQLSERRIFSYPPFSRLIGLSLKHRDHELLSIGAEMLVRDMRNHFGNRVFGPHTPVVERIGGEWLMNVLLKIERKKSFAEAKRTLANILRDWSLDERFRKIFVSINVDPQ